MRFLNLKRQTPTLSVYVTAPFSQRANEIEASIASSIESIPSSRQIC